VLRFSCRVSRHPYLIVAGILLTAASCGYRVGSVPCEALDPVRTVAVPLFQNDSLALRAGDLFTEAFRERLQAIPCIRLHPGKDADAVLKGVVLSVNTFPVAVDTDFLALQYGVRVALSVSLVQRNDGKTLWESGEVEEEGRFYASSDPMLFQNNRYEAIKKLSRRMSERVMDQLLLGFGAF